MTMRNRLRAILGGIAALVLVLVLAPGMTQAAGSRQTADTIPLPPTPPASLDPEPPPYEDKLDRLAELMGTLAFMRDLCGNHDGEAWRTRMDALLSSEGTTPARRDRLAGSYNRGYTGYRLSYRSCTPAAQTVINRALGEGARIATDVSARFSPHD